MEVDRTRENGRPECWYAHSHQQEALRATPAVSPLDPEQAKSCDAPIETMPIGSDSTQADSDRENYFHRSGGKPRPAPVDDPAYVAFFERFAQLGEDVVRQIANYQPREIPEDDWLRIRDFVIEVGAATTNLKHRDPVVHLQVVARFVHYWHVVHGYPLEVESLFTLPLIIAFIERVLKDHSASYQVTARSRLLRVTRVLNPNVVLPFPEKKRRVVANPPYETWELDRFQVRFESIGSAYVRRCALLILAISSGAGLNTSDYVRLRIRDIQIDPRGPSSGIEIDVPDNGMTARTSLRPRRIAMLPAWESVVREWLCADPSLEKNDFVVWNNLHPDKRNNLQAISRPFQRVTTVHERPQVYRLRSTWIVAHLRLGTPINIIRDAAGLNSAESLFRYLQYIESPDWETRRRFLRGEGWPRGVQRLSALPPQHLDE